MHAKLLQSCLTLCDPIDCNIPGSSVHGSLQARILEWVAIPFSRGGDLPDPGIEPTSPALQAASLPWEPPGKPTHWTSSTAQIEVILSGWERMIFPLTESYEWIEVSQEENWVGENTNVKSGMVSWKNLVWCSGKWIMWFQIRVYGRAIAIIKYRY